MLAEELALRIRRRRRIKGSIATERLYSLAESLGLEIIEYPFQVFDEVYLCGVVVLNPRLTTQMKRWLIAHALYHHLRHDGNQLYRDSTDQSWWTRQQERGANLFAGYLLWGTRANLGPIEPYELAEESDVPTECVEQWRLLCEAC